MNILAVMDIAAPTALAKVQTEASLIRSTGKKMKMKVILGQLQRSL